MKEKIGMDAFRYFVLRESVFGQDADFRQENLIARYNADLANNLGNLVSRVLAMQAKYFGGVVQPLGMKWADEDNLLKSVYDKAESEIRRHLGDLQFHRALEVLWAALDHTNRYVVQTSPFTLFKDPAHQGRVGEILHHLLQAICRLALLLEPFMPETAKELQLLLGFDERSPALAAPWGKSFAAGHQVNGPKLLFPRIEVPATK
jgi:methionyl-tRNA synthetase